MDNRKEFEILIRRKIPFISNFLYVVTIFFLAFLFLLYLVMLPAVHSESSAEMQTAYYILAVPESLKVLSSYSFLGLVVFVPLYYPARLHRPAILRFDDNNLVITGKKVSVDIPKNRIRKVYCNDLKNIFGEPKDKLQVVVQQHAFRKTTFRLKNYEQGGEMIDAFGTLDNAILAGYDREMVGDHDEDE
jgi:hypothetical protein